MPFALGGAARRVKSTVRDDLFEAKGKLKVQSLRVDERVWTPEGKR